MAVYKGREVNLLSAVQPKSLNPVFVTVGYKDGMKERVNLSEIRFTKEEKRELLKNHVDNINEISDEELNALRDSQNPDKVNQPISSREIPKIETKAKK